MGPKHAEWLAVVEHLLTRRPVAVTLLALLPPHHVAGVNLTIVRRDLERFGHPLSETQLRALLDELTTAGVKIEVTGVFGKIHWLPKPEQFALVAQMDEAAHRRTPRKAVRRMG